MPDIRPLALVTGASSGIGAELSVELAKSGHDLLLTGRDAGRLAEVANRVTAAGARAETLVLDLGNPILAIAALLKAVADRPLSVLVNNAGFGMAGDFIAANPEELAAMLSLNITTLTLLTRAIVPSMVARKGGRILNVASLAGFMATPGMTAYGATKAYVLSFSQGLAEELAGSGVRVNVLCPGATTTRFAQRAAIESSAMFKSAMSAETVARIGIRGLLSGRRIQVAGLLNTITVFFIRFFPRTLLSKAVYGLTKA